MNEFDYLAKAKDKMCKEKFVEAKSLCDKAIKINSELPCAYNCRGNANYELGYYKEAIEDFAKAIEKEPNNAEHYYDRGWVYKQMKRLEDAILDMDKAITLEPKKSFYYFWRAEFKFEKGRYKEAIADYTKGIELNPTENKYIGRGNAYRILDMFDLAISDHTAAIEIEPESYIAYYYRGVVKMKLEQFQEAIKDFEKTLEINPEDADAYLQIGYAKTALGKKDAIKYFNKAVKAFPSAYFYLERVKARVKILLRETALENLAQNKDICTDFFDRKLFNKKQAQDDIKDLNKALKDDPDNIEALEFRADRYFYLEKFDKSVADLTKLIELEPDTPKYYYTLALIELHRGKYREVIDDCNKFFELSGNEIDTDVFFLRAKAEYKLKQYKKVIDDTTVVISFDDSFGGYYYRGLAHYKLGHFRQAISDIRKAIEIKSDVLETYEDKLPKLFKLGVRVNKGANEKNQSNIKKSKTQRPIGLAGLNKG